jgi:hypothetical protein
MDTKLTIRIDQDLVEYFRACNWLRVSSKSKCRLISNADGARNEGDGNTHDAKRKPDLRIDRHGIDAHEHGTMRRRGENRQPEGCDQLRQ